MSALPIIKERWEAGHSCPASLGGERGHQVVPVAGGDLPAALLVFLVRLPVGKEPPLDRLLVGAVAEGGEVAPDQHDLEVPLRRALGEPRPVKREGDDAAFALELFQDGQVLRPVARQPLVGLARRQLVVARLYRPGRRGRLRPRGLTDGKRKEKIEKRENEIRVSPEASGFGFRFSDRSSPLPARPPGAPAPSRADRRKEKRENRK